MYTNNSGKKSLLFIQNHFIIDALQCLYISSSLKPKDTPIQYFLTFKTHILVFLMKERKKIQVFLNVLKLKKLI